MMKHFVKFRLFVFYLGVILRFQTCTSYLSWKNLVVNKPKNHNSCRQRILDTTPSFFFSHSISNAMQLYAVEELKEKIEIDNLCNCKGKKKKAIVIGSGIGGLVVAGKLKKRGPIDYCCNSS